MPRKKVTNDSTTAHQTSLVERLHKINVYLTTVFLVLWIFVGIFASLLVIQSVRQGFLKGVFSNPQATTAAQAPAQTEADLPGVGKVNIACVEQALSQDAISKILQNGNTSGLTDAEKTKLDTCTVAQETATPSATPTAQ